ncbi:MAG TPA: protein-glutamate O-methyltransferase CheR [Nitrospirales bacterium]|nr:protein-glutamate O-methyltransferase CheR [Nitrospirales bacterium]
MGVRPNSTAGSLSESTFRDLQGLIYEQSGIFFAENKKYVLEERLRPRLVTRGCDSFEDYYCLLRYDAWRDQELIALFDLVTTNETYFYRDRQQLLAFTETIVPTVIAANKERKWLRIWSAACSTGDEPYTLALMLLEMPALTEWTIEILATDISEASLASARRGSYDAYAVRNVPPAVLKRYFTEDGGRYVIGPQARAMVKFMTLNLYDTPRMKIMRGLDVIFCRNCLIYFDDKAKKRIVQGLTESLRVGGYLVIGFSESLHGVRSGLEPIHSHRAVIYRKAEEQ